MAYDADFISSQRSEISTPNLYSLFMKGNPQTPNNSLIEESGKSELGFLTYFNAAEILISLLYAWDFDPQLDMMCKNVLGLSNPKFPLSLGLISRKGNHFSIHA